MAKERIEKTLIILDEEDIRKICRLARRPDPDRVLEFMLQVIGKRVEAALRRRCK
ncbi:MAG: hypothetical protein ACUVSB_13570 [Anaerolineae bacterium]